MTCRMGWGLTRRNFDVRVLGTGGWSALSELSYRQVQLPYLVVSEVFVVMFVIL